MKHRILFPLAGALLLGASNSYGAYYSNFTGLSNGDPLIPGNTNPGFDGWVQSEINQDPPGSFTPDDAPLAYGQPVNGTPGLTLSGSYGTSVNDSVNVSHTINLPLGGISTNMSFTVGRDTADSVQNSFEIGAYDGGGNNLFSFVIDRTSNIDIWKMFYRVGNGSKTAFTFTNSLGIDLDSLYDLSFSVAANGDLNLVVDPATGAPVSQTLTGTGLNASSTYSSLKVSMLKVPGTDPIADPFAAYGINGISFTNVVVDVVPEPTSILLCSLGVGAFLIRRRRA